MKFILKPFFLRAIILLLCSLNTANSMAQIEPLHSPNGLFDTVADRYGNRIPISNIYIPTARYGTANVVSSIITTCQAGYFTLHFESGSLFDLSASARTVACQVFQDVSNYIVSNAAAGSIHIHCGHMTTLGFAEATPYYVYPNFLANQNQGIIDGQIYKALVSGTNPYLSQPVGLNNANQIYHGRIAATTNTAVNINYNLTTTSIASNEYDLYSALLHEVTHALGFISLMRYDGLSQFTPPSLNYPFYSYYSRYDNFLYDNNGNKLLSAPIGSCATSNLTFAPSSYSVIGEGMSVCPSSLIPQDITTCSVGAKYIGSTTATVYTPYFFETGSSLSHFEDICSGSYTGTCTSSPGNNNLYFVMANFIGSGNCYVKRHHMPEERLVLCDLGYSVNASYGGTAVAGSTYSYSGGACTPSNIIGQNDGYYNGQFTLQVTSGNSTVIPFSTLLANDSPTTGIFVSCMELVTNNATFTLGGSDFSVTASQAGGVVVLKYIPQNSSGQIGNATFVFIKFVPPGCLSCGIVNNGGFESSTATFSASSCGQIDNLNSARTIDCWYAYGTNYMTDLFNTICTSFPLQLGVSTMYTSPPINTLSLGPGTNTNAIGLSYNANGINGAVVNTLNTPLTFNQAYQMSFWVINYSSSNSSYNLNGPANPAVLSLASSTTLINPYAPQPAGFPNSLNSLLDFTVSAGDTWAQVTGTFVYTQSVAATQIVLGINAIQTQTPTSINSNGLYYCFIDEISIIPIPGPNFSIPNNTICTSGSMANLSLYTGTTSGVFSGPGVSFSGTQYDFNLTSTLTPGVYPIAFTYTNPPTNCLNTIYQSVNVINCCASTSITAITATTFTGSTVLLGPKLFPNSFTIQPGADLWLSGEFLISAGVKITVSSTATLYIAGAHLYGCLAMWQGIEVLDGGVVKSVSAGGHENLIEDAEIAIAINNYTSATNPILDINSTTFNKNYISIDITNYTANVTNAFRFNKTVFTCRNFTFTATSWPHTGTVTPDLRYTGSANSLTAPYLLQSAPITSLKAPYTTNRSHCAIQLTDVGTTTGTMYPLTFNSVDLSPSNAGNFNLFDAHETFISAVNSNVKVSNSVFQNTQTFSVSSTATFAAAIQHSNSTASNFELDLTSSSASLGNKFYNCHYAVKAKSSFNFKMENTTIRSTQSLSSGSPTFQGVFIETNQAGDYRIKNNEITNVRDGVNIVFFPAPTKAPDLPFYADATQTVYIYATYIRTLAVNQNTFSPEINTTFSTTNNYIKNAVSLTSPPLNFAYVWSSCSCNSLTINDNTIYHAFNGIKLSGLNSYTLTCRNSGTPKIIANNTITLSEDPSNDAQRGIEFTNSSSLPVNQGQKIQTVENNILTVAGGTVAQNNQNITLYYGQDNGAVGPYTGSLYPTPHIICNDLSNAYRGFVFNDWNLPASWRGNKMENLTRGMTLESSGRIGQQGDLSNPIDNEWNSPGNWTSSTHGIWTSASVATLSPIYVNTISTTMNPPNLWGSPFATSYFSGGVFGAFGSYHCGTSSNYTLMNSAFPIANQYDSDESFYIANSFAYRYLSINDSMKDVDQDLTNFYNDLSGSSIDKFTQIELKTNKGHFTEAQTLLDGLNTTNFHQVETNYYNFYLLYLKYMKGEDPLTLDDIDALYNISSLCPGTNGSVVFQTRALYQLLTGKIYNGPDGCSESGARSGAPPENKPENKMQWDVEMFPNPAQNQLSIIGKSHSEILEVVIKDLTGKILLSCNLKTIQFIAVMDLDLINGAYFIIISNSNNDRITKKLLISK